jgi:hypothetical protein
MRMGHPEPSALEYLVNAFKRMEIKSPIVIQCEACALAKIRKQIRRAPKKSNEGSEKRIAVNFHNYASGINEHIFQMILTNQATGYVWDYYFADFFPGAARLFCRGRPQAGHEHFLHGLNGNIYALMTNLLINK